MPLTCKQCQVKIEWGKLCDDCADRERDRAKSSTPDHRRCVVCGTFKTAPGHSEFLCLKREQGY